MRHNFEKFCKDYENIENYEKAKKDDFKGWNCHHRLETHNSDGERRLVDIPHKELIALGMYYNRPAEELIFLTTREHNAFKKGKKRSEETKKKIGEGRKGKKLSEETKQKLSEANKGNSYHLGKHHSEEAKRKMREAAKGNTNTKGKHWYNNGEINTMAKECPPGFIPGMLK